MMNKTIYVVVGKSGRYDDIQTWNVIAYDTQKQARFHADLAKITGDMFIDRFHDGTKPKNVWWCGWDEDENPFDNKARMLDLDKSSLEYIVEEIFLSYDNV